MENQNGAFTGGCSPPQSEAGITQKHRADQKQSSLRIKKASEQIL